MYRLSDENVSGELGISHKRKYEDKSDGRNLFERHKTRISQR